MADFRVGRNDEEGTSWSVLSDIAITMVLFLVIVIVYQHLQTYKERAILEALRQRAQEVRESIDQVAAGRVQVDSLAPDRQQLTFSDATLFELCQADLKPDGVRLLQEVGMVIRRHRGVLETVSVVGHTDTLAIRGRQCPFADNWELSSARATSVVGLWSRGGQVPDTMMSATGRSQYHPVDPNNLAANRRIEVVLQFKRVAAPDSTRSPRMNTGRP